MTSKKLTVLIGSLTVLIAVAGMLSVADDSRESVSTVVFEPAMSFEVESLDMLQESQLAENEAMPPLLCCCLWGCYGPPPCPAGCVASVGCQTVRT